MILKYLADVNISPKTVGGLHNSGYEIYRVTKFLSATASDNEIIELAITENFVIITQDLDFSDLIVLRGLNKPSIISLRIDYQTPENVKKIIEKLLPEIEGELKEGCIVSVEESRFRIRKLPVG